MAESQTNRFRSVLTMIASRLSPKNRRSLPSAGSAAPIVVILLALLISGGIFYFYTRKKLQAQASVTSKVEAPAASSSAPTSPVAVGDKPKAVPQPQMAAPKESAQVPATPSVAAPAAQASPGFARPLDLGKAFSQSLATGDMAGAARLAPTPDATTSAAATAVLEKMVKGLGYKVGSEDKVVLLGQVGEATRLSIPLMKPGEKEPSLNLQIDVERDPKMGWKITKFHLPKELQAAIAEAPPSLAMTTSKVGQAAPPASAVGTSMPATAGSKGGSPLFVVETEPDSLSYASDFIRALLKLDFTSARKLIDDSKVSPQKIAGLCIVFEEGQYELKPNKPMVITVASPQVSWVIAQVQSEKLQQHTEFGVEMQRESPDKPWKIVGLNLSDLLGSFAQSATKMGVPYTPIVTNPKGGESLALYFEYDQSGLHPRAKKQLEIVAGLLKSNGARKLHITGHTDALGTDGYNMGLSRGRAQAVKEELVSLGVSPDQVVTEGVGKAAPLGPNQKSDGSDNPEGRSKNRRAEIFLDF